MTGHYEERILQEFIDGRMSESACTAIRMHLDTCPSCAVLHRSLEAVDGILHQLPHASADPRMSAYVLARIVRPRKETSLDRLLRPHVLASLVFVLFGAVGGTGAFLTASHETPGYGMAVEWERVLTGTSRTLGLHAETVSALIAGWVPPLLSTQALQVALAVVLLVPLILGVDQILAKRRVIG